MEPMNPENYVVVISTETIDGRRGKAKVKKWWEGEKYLSKVLSFEPYEEGDNNACISNEDRQS